jgi:Tol biopolymer transport system component
MDDQPLEKLEPLGAPRSYEPLPTNKIFPAWEWTLKFGWIGALAVAGAVGYRFWKPDTAKTLTPAQHFAPAAQWTREPGFNLAPAISHDGKLAAYTSDREGSGNLAIWTRPVGAGNPVRLTSGDFNDADPDFSPDDRLIAYRSERDGGGIYILPVAGGVPPKLVAKNGWRPRFSPDGKWIAFFRQSGADEAGARFGLGQVFIVSSEGGEPRRIQPSFQFGGYPIWSPNGRYLLFTGVSQDGTKDWWLSPIDGGEAARTHALEWLDRSLRTVGYPEHWRGESIFLSGAEESDSHVWELPISSSSMQVTGPPQRLSDGKGQELQMALGSDGRLLFTSLELSSDIWSLPIDANQAKALGKLEPVTSDAVRAQLPAIAANGSKMVYMSSRSGVRDIWVSDPDGKAARTVTSFRQVGYRPLLSPDGTQLVYPAIVDQTCVVTLQDVAKPGRSSTLKGCFSIWDWSPDGSSLLTVRTGRSKMVDLMKISTGELQTVLSHPSSNLFSARFSPDGRWIAFAAGATGAHTQVFIAPLRGSAVTGREWIMVSAEGGDPAWSPDGNVLYFRSKRDTTHCIWARKLGPGKIPSGEPIGVLHLHSAALGVAFLKPTELGIAVTRDRLTLNLGRTSGTLWTMMLPRNKASQVVAASQRP